ncbi:hypothetical protein Tco_0345174 [Tanacetum coccineum]
MATSQEAVEEEKEILLLSSQEEYSHNMEERKEHGRNYNTYTYISIRVCAIVVLRRARGVFNPHLSLARNFACVLLTTDALIGLRHGPELLLMFPLHLMIGIEAAVYF